jgi:hypothetical protein
MSTQRTTATPSANAQALHEILSPYCTEENYDYRDPQGQSSLPPGVGEQIIAQLAAAGFTWDTISPIDHRIYAYLDYIHAATIHPILRRLRNNYSHLLNP